MTINRINTLPNKSFLLLGPRGTGKSTWLKSALPEALHIDLLSSSVYLTLSQNPSKLEQMVSSLGKGQWVVIDEIQRIPLLLNEVQRLYLSNGLHFALSGSSARKLRRSEANLLAGRAIQLNMYPFTYAEYAGHWSIEDSVEWGSLPLVVTDASNRIETLATYVDVYLKEEIAAEALVRRLDPFVRVLQAAGLYNGQILNLENLARESQVKRSTVDRYFQILEDTLLANRVPAVQLGIRTKETSHPKFFLFDNGVARAAAGLLRTPVDSIWRGFAFEALLFQEIRAYGDASKNPKPVFHYSVSGSFDVDFLIELHPKTLSTPRKFIALEVKSGRTFRKEWIAGLKVLKGECPQHIEASYLVYLGNEELVIEGIQVLPIKVFLTRMHQSEIF